MLDLPMEFQSAYQAWQGCCLLGCDKSGKDRLHHIRKVRDRINGLIPKNIPQSCILDLRGLTSEQERLLACALLEIGECVDAKDYTSLLFAFLGLPRAVEEFASAHNLSTCTDPATRNNQLALLRALLHSLDSFCDWSKISA